MKKTVIFFGLLCCTSYAFGSPVNKAELPGDVHESAANDLSKYEVDYLELLNRHVKQSDQLKDKWDSDETSYLDVEKDGLADVGSVYDDKFLSDSDGENYIEAGEKDFNENGEHSQEDSVHHEHAEIQHEDNPQNKDDTSSGNEDYSAVDEDSPFKQANVNVHINM